MDDRISATVVEFQMDHTGKVWVNVDGKCALRIGKARFVSAVGASGGPAKMIYTDWPRRGDKMRFLGKNGYAQELESAKRTFAEGGIYEVENCEVGDSHHVVGFKGVPGRHNGVMFELVVPEIPVEDPGKPRMGKIEDWIRVVMTGGRIVYSGRLERLGWEEGTTSLVVRETGTEIETRNSIYKLGKPISQGRGPRAHAIVAAWKKQDRGGG